MVGDGMRWGGARALFVSAVVVIVSIGSSAPALARTHGGGGGRGGGGGSSGGGVPTGIDVSYPQCGSSLPTTRAFAVVGVNGGLANDYNACLSSEYAYATRLTAATKQPGVQSYVNTGDPGNGVADWPSPSQLGAYGSVATPVGSCGFASGASGPGADSAACAYIYGYDMVRGITYRSGSGTAAIAGDVAAYHSATGSQLYVHPVWLDVETGNSWQSASQSGGLAMNIADLQGMVASVAAASSAAGVAAPVVGVYSTASQWNAITGTPGASGGNLSGVPDWIPGAQSENGAVANCSQRAFTGGAVSITQWVGSLDGDYSCIG